MAAQEDILFNFRRDINKPLDHWDTVATLAERDALPVGVRYAGMGVFVEANSTNYQLTGGVENSNWAVPAGGSGQTEAQVNTQIDAIFTSSTLLTAPNGNTFEAGTGTGTGDAEATITNIAFGIANGSGVGFVSAEVPATALVSARSIDYAGSTVVRTRISDTLDLYVHFGDTGAAVTRANNTIINERLYVETP